MEGPEVKNSDLWDFPFEREWKQEHERAQELSPSSGKQEIKAQVFIVPHWGQAFETASLIWHSLVTWEIDTQVSSSMYVYLYKKVHLQQGRQRETKSN